MESSNEPEEHIKTHGEGESESYFDAAIWWSMLVVAVLAIPAISIVLSLLLPISTAWKTVTFVLSCWLCTWIGMWLMRKADEREMKK